MRCTSEAYSMEDGARRFSGFFLTWLFLQTARLSPRKLSVNLAIDRILSENR